MLAYRRQQAVEEFLRNDGESDTIVALECWKYARLDNAQRGQNYRLTHIAEHTSRVGPRGAEIEDRLAQWLQFQGPYQPLSPPPNSGVFQGGLRLILCDRPNLRVGMTMSYHCFSMISGAFNLHSATLAEFCMDRGAYTFFVDDASTTNRKNSIRVVMKFPQKVEIANYTLSLTYDLSTGWTNALVCGAGVLLDRKMDTLLGGQYKQLIDAILTAPCSWDNPLFLPLIMLDNYIDRLDWRAHHIDMLLSRLETQLGVTFVGKAGGEAARKRWPQDIDTEQANIDVQTISTHVALLLSCTDWSRSCLSALLKAGEMVSKFDGLQDSEIDFVDLRDSAKTLLSIVEGIHRRFNVYSTRANLQSNVLFNVIGQQESILTRQDTKLSSLIAKSSKRDSTSMIAFTFITALFLPGTFIATLFSMSMFNFQPENDGDSIDADASAPVTQRYISTKFWIFWATALPLTFITMATWYLWSRYANERWLKKLYLAAPSLEENFGSLDNVGDVPTPSHQIWDVPPPGLKRRRSSTAGVYSKDEIRMWFKSPGQV